MAFKSLLVGDEPLNCRGVGLVERARLAEPALASAALAREQMAQEGALMLDLAVFAELEALVGAAIGFDLRHTVARSFYFYRGDVTATRCLSPMLLPQKEVDKSLRRRFRDYARMTVKSRLLQSAAKLSLTRRQQDRHITPLHSAITFRLGDIPNLFDDPLE
jgi:hypothetical protein